MYLVDTSISSYHQRGHPTVSQRIAATAVGLLYTSVVAVEEQFRGRLAVIAQNSQTPHRLIPAYVDLEQGHESRSLRPSRPGPGPGRAQGLKSPRI